MRKYYSGWLKNGFNHMLFEGIYKDLKVGDIITDYKGNKWTVEVIF